MPVTGRLSDTSSSSSSPPEQRDDSPAARAPLRREGRASRPTRAGPGRRRTSPRTSSSTSRRVVLAIVLVLPLALELGTDVQELAGAALAACVLQAMAHWACAGGARRRATH